MISFEILLPQFYNDGRPIEPQKFLVTDDELVPTFGATSTDQIGTSRKRKRRVLLKPSLTLPARQNTTRKYWRNRPLDIWSTGHRSKSSNKKGVRD